MKSPSNSNKDEKVKLPWEAELEVQDLIKPITVRRIWLLQTVGLVLMVLAVGIFAWWLFVKPPSGKTLVKEMIVAAGGMQEWKNIQDGSFVRTHRMYDENGKIIKESEETFFFKNNPDGRQLLIKSITNQKDEVYVGHDDGGYWALFNDVEVNPVTLAKEMEFMCDSEFCSPLCASEMALYRMSFPFKLADDGIDHALHPFRVHRALADGDVDGAGQLVTVEGGALAVLLHHRQIAQLDPLERREAPATAGTGAPAPDRGIVLRRARILHLGIGILAIGTAHDGGSSVLLLA